MMKMTIGDNMRIYRAKKRITQSELAAQLNLSPSSISYIENDWLKKCSIEKFIEIILFLNLTPEETYESLIAYHKSLDKHGKCNCQ